MISSQQAIYEFREGINFCSAFIKHFVFSILHQMKPNRIQKPNDKKELTPSFPTVLSIFPDIIIKKKQSNEYKH